MTESYLAVAVQMESGEDKPANLEAAIRLAEEAAALGAKLVALPELFNCFGRFETIVAQAEPIPGPTSEAMARLAERLGITLVAGSMAERVDDSNRAFNTSLTFGPDGALLARYRKVHLAEIDLPGRATLCESRWIAAGDDVVAAATLAGTLGLAICYDLRFPELFRRLSSAGAELLVMPSAFTRATGRDHWEVLLRARAIENLAYVVAPNQCAAPGGVAATFGHSTIIDPWGRVLAMADDGAGETLVSAKIDRAALAQVRAELPALQNRRL